MKGSGQPCKGELSQVTAQEAMVIRKQTSKVTQRKLGGVASQITQQRAAKAMGSDCFPEWLFALTDIGKAVAARHTKSKCQYHTETWWVLSI